MNKFVRPAGTRWRPCGVSSKLRVLRYGEADFFKPHVDGNCVASPSERSFLTGLLYLNDVEGGGGGTRFLPSRSDAPPAVELEARHQRFESSEPTTARAGQARAPVPVPAAVWPAAAAAAGHPPFVPRGLGAVLPTMVIEPAVSDGGSCARDH